MIERHKHLIQERFPNNRVDLYLTHAPYNFSPILEVVFDGKPTGVKFRPSCVFDMMTDVHDKELVDDLVERLRSVSK